MKEQEIARIITEQMPQNPLRKTGLNHCDAEHLQGDGINLLVTTDEFSSEDLFREHNASTLGWNIAVASLSDIYAAGGKPFQLTHAVKVPPHWDESYIRSFSRGVAEVLEKTGTGFLGGDLSAGAEWSYTATVLGKPPAFPLLRTGIQSGDRIYISGKLGAGNFEAALQLYKDHPLLGPLSRIIPNRFPLRDKESCLLLPWAAACIDTSDGVFSSLNTLADLNGLGFTVENLAIKSFPATLSRLVRKPDLLLFLGGAGEYELLAAIPKDKEEDFLKQAENKRLPFYSLGYFTEHRERLLHYKGKKIDLRPFIVSNRDFKHPKELLNFLIKEINHG